MEAKTGRQTKKDASPAPADTAPVAVMVRVDQVHVKQGFNPRTDVGDTADLRANIKLHKRLLNPLTVCPREKGGGYWLICGGRRFQAVQELKWATVPACVIPDLKIDGARALALAISENSSGEDGLRQELEPLDQAQAFQKLADQLSSSGEASDAGTVAKMSGCSSKTVRRMLSLLTVSKRVAKMIRAKEISVRAALVVATLDDADLKAKAEQAIQEGFTEDRVTAIVNDLRRESRRALEDPAAPDMTGEPTEAPEEGSRKNLPKGQPAGTRVLVKGRKEIRKEIDTVAANYLNAREESKDDELISAYANQLAALLWVVGLVPEISTTSEEFNETCELLAKELERNADNPPPPAETDGVVEDDDSAEEEGEDDEDASEDVDEEEESDDEESDDEEEASDEDDDDEDASEEADDDAAEEEDPAPRSPRTAKRGAIDSDDDVE
jgi:ParB/RepB/Spo0J family partition protein